MGTADSVAHTCAWGRGGGSSASVLFFRVAAVWMLGVCLL